MEELQIKRLILELQAIIGDQKPEVSTRAFGETALYANKAGFISLAIELLKCASDELRNEANIDRLITQDSDFFLEHLCFEKDYLDLVSE